MERRPYNPKQDKEERLRRRRLEEFAQMEAQTKQEQEHGLLFKLIKTTSPPPPEAVEPLPKRHGYTLPFFRRNG